MLIEAEKIYTQKVVKAWTTEISDVTPKNLESIVKAERRDPYRFLESNIMLEPIQSISLTIRVRDANTKVILSECTMDIDSENKIVFNEDFEKIRQFVLDKTTRDIIKELKLFVI